MPYHPSVRKQKQAEYVARNKERLREKQKAWYQTNRDAQLELMRRRYSEKRDEVRAEQRAYYQENVGSIRAKQAEWKAANPNYDRDRYAFNPAPFIAKSSSRRAAELQRRPRWDNELDEMVMLEAADLAVRRRQATGIDWHVDHIVPLRGDTVCGLHVWNNLQVIPAVENVRKGNRFQQGAA